MLGRVLAPAHIIGSLITCLQTRKSDMWISHHDSSEKESPTSGQSCSDTSKARESYSNIYTSKLDSGVRGVGGMKNQKFLLPNVYWSWPLYFHIYWLFIHQSRNAWDNVEFQVKAGWLGARRGKEVHWEGQIMYLGKKKRKEKKRKSPVSPGQSMVITYSPLGKIHSSPTAHTWCFQMEHSLHHEIKLYL